MSIVRAFRQIGVVPNLARIIPRYFNKSCKDRSSRYESFLQKVMNDQIAVELQAGREYLCMAAYFGSRNVGLKGMYGFLMHQYKGEIDHAEKLIKYQIIRGGAVELLQLEKVSPEKLTILEALKRSLCMETTLAEKLDGIAAIANQQGDHECADFIIKNILEDQNKEIYDISTMLNSMKSLASDHGAILLYDMKLAKKFPL